MYNVLVTNKFYCSYICDFFVWESQKLFQYSTSTVIILGKTCSICKLRGEEDLSTCASCWEPFHTICAGMMPTYSSQVWYNNIQFIGIHYTPHTFSAITVLCIKCQVQLKVSASQMGHSFTLEEGMYTEAHRQNMVTVRRYGGENSLLSLIFQTLDFLPKVNISK
jgi:hypothetical protein